MLDGAVMSASLVCPLRTSVASDPGCRRSQQSIRPIRADL